MDTSATMQKVKTPTQVKVADTQESKAMTPYWIAKIL
jgi:hypothetical protein